MESILENVAPEVFVNKIKIGDTTAFVQPGKKALHKRFFICRELQPNKISFESATSLAIRFGFMKELLEWLEANKDWKDGAYVETGS
ncbi:MAG: hypothetical protein ABI863_08855 [Ginsengibacter sp.]